MPVQMVLHDMRSQVTSSQGMYEATWAFHMALANIGGNCVMAKLVRVLYEMIAEIQLKLCWPYIDLQDELRMHEKLFSAVLEGDKEAELAMQDHLDRAANIAKQAIVEGVGIDKDSKRNPTQGEQPC